MRNGDVPMISLLLILVSWTIQGVSPFLVMLSAAASGRSNQIQWTSGPFRPSQVGSCWGRQPMLVRNAFEPSSLISSKAWPSWDQICSWSSYSDDEEEEEPQVMSRLIRNEKDRLNWFTLELGPFERSYVQALAADRQDEQSWTLVLNNVDRIHPPLHRWMNRVFGSDYFPRWRLDDGQISIATTGGGIGPHVDNYDVFLIQTSGTRRWLLGDFISCSQEMESLVDGSDVRVLDLTCSAMAGALQREVELNPGDLLYLPPRLVHWGTALSDDCMTLSVGCRAPSASELVSRVAEHLSYSVEPAAVRRYVDYDLLSTREDRSGCESMTQQVKEDMKRLLLDAVADVVNDPLIWDEIVGRLSTEPKRPMDAYSTTFGQGETQESHMDQVEKALKNGVGSLWPKAGVSFATSRVKQNDHFVNRVFADGHLLEWKTPTCQVDEVQLSERIMSAINGCRALTKEVLNGVHLSPEVMSFLRDLMEGEHYYFLDETAQDYTTDR